MDITLTPQTRPERVPLSSAQRQLWFLDRLGQGSSEYNLLDSFRLIGELDRSALEQAVNIVVERHEVLRTRFLEVDGEPVQVIEPVRRIGMHFEDLRGLPETVRQERTHEEIGREYLEPFDLTYGPVARLKLLRLADNEHVLLRTIHHIVCDAWSMAVFNKEMMVLYECLRQGVANPLPSLPVQYADYALWERRLHDGEALDKEVAYWTEMLTGIPDCLTLPRDRPRARVQTFEAGMCRVELCSETLRDLKQLSLANRASLFMTLLSLFGILLSAYSGQEDIVIGSPISMRREIQLEGLIGLFVNSLVLRMHVMPEMSFQQLLREARRMMLGAFEHQNVPFARLVDALAPRRNPGTPPLTQVWFVMQNAPSVMPSAANLRVEPMMRSDFQIRYDLEVHAQDYDGTMVLLWLYNRHLFDSWRIEQMAQHYRRLAEVVIESPDTQMGRLDFLSS